MALEMTEREVNGVTVLVLNGEMGLGKEATALREKVKTLLAAGKPKLLLDMGGVTLIDSAGLGTLVGVHQSAISGGASLRLCNLSSKLKELLVMTRLIVVFGDGVSESQADAVRRLSTSA